MTFLQRASFFVICISIWSSKQTGGTAKAHNPSGHGVNEEGRGSFPKPHYDQDCNKQKCQLVQDKIPTQVEEGSDSKMVSMSKQGASKRCEQVEHCKFLCRALGSWTLCTKFLIVFIWRPPKPSQPAHLESSGHLECKLCQRWETCWAATLSL